jgi:uncharacterized phiE125 gp8 family phage protein
MELKILSTTIMEPVTVADTRTFIGYDADDQDDVIRKMITTAREWLENRCALSLVNKQYTAYFEKSDARNGWYELPVAPVLSTPALVVAVNGVTVTAEEMGQSVKRVRPAVIYGTIGVGATSSNWYMEVTFNAGATNNTANEVIKKIVTTMFNNREEGTGAVPVGRLPYDTMRLIESIDNNTGL